MLTKYQPVYDGLLKRKENLIYVYGLNGKKKNIYYIPFSYQHIIFGEAENISFNDGKMVIQFNHSNKAGYFTASYKEEVNSNINIETNDPDNTSYSVYLDEEEIIKTKATSNTIPINFKYTEEGNYEYTIKTNGEVEEPEEKYKDIISNLEVEVYYEPVVNKLKVKSNADNLILSEDNLYDKEEYQKINDALVVDVPDTKSNDYLYLVGLLLIIFSSNYIYIRRLN